MTAGDTTTTNFQYEGMLHTSHFVFKSLCFLMYDIFPWSHSYVFENNANNMKEIRLIHRALKYAISCNRIVSFFLVWKTINTILMKIKQTGLVIGLLLQQTTAVSNHTQSCNTFNNLHWKNFFLAIYLI